MAMLKKAALKVLELIKRIPIAAGPGGYNGGNSYGGPAKGINHNGVGLGAPGPKNKFGMNGRSGY
ncbi:hypothetical protein AWB69_02840 [Caballeronia udeis]|uniref:Uncharacterized protein n=1 Tax=Caballeronia udeis TaxID=1232866 RepID=A0A158GLM1_9BURK|nr:hypothetical protein [Caballeronia udeis]SAL32509.1 hypothetical protein AWB69_02840 [Caballeronia udeis]